MLRNKKQSREFIIRTQGRVNQSVTIRGINKIKIILVRDSKAPKGTNKSQKGRK